jgi:CRP-like cAMP-binding protein
MQKSITEMLDVDESTRRLMELTSQQIRNEDDIDEIITLIQEKAPKLLDALSDANKEKIALHCFLKTYGKNKAVFHQGDVPDTYYTILRGAVSIFTKTSDAASLEINDSRAYVKEIIVQSLRGAYSILFLSILILISN